MAAAIDPETIQLSWNPPPVAEQNGILRHYFVSLVSEEHTVTQNVTAPQTSVTIFELRPYRQYACTVTAVTVDVGVPTEEIVIRSPEAGLTLVIKYDVIAISKQLTL